MKSLHRELSLNPSTIKFSVYCEQKQVVIFIRITVQHWQVTEVKIIRIQPN